LITPLDELPFATASFVHNLNTLREQQLGKQSASKAEAEHAAATERKR
jgi:hypothetical protein